MSPPTQPLSPSIDDLLSASQDHLDAFQFEEAESAARKALNLDPTNPDAHLALAAVLIETGKVDDGRECLLEAARLQPSAGAEKFFCLAQLSEGEESLGYYVAGINILRTTPQDEGEHQAQRVASAMAAAAELFMTDLCELPDAEAQCEQLLREAHDLNPGNVEVLRVLTDLRLVQQRPVEAADCMSRCLGTWFCADSGQRDLDAQPSYDFRQSCAKLLIELQQYDTAESLILQLIEDDDEMALTWYLLGVCLHAGPSGNARQAREAFLEAKRLLNMVPEEDRDYELLDSIEEFVNGLPPAGEDNDDDVVDGEENEWEDEESDD